MDDDKAAKLATELAWLAGLIAGRDSLPFDDNPHPVGTDLSQDWANGWLEGERLRQMRRPRSDSLSLE